jgi:hypothetical protein
MTAKSERTTRGMLGSPSLVAAMAACLCHVALAGPTDPPAADAPPRADGPSSAVVEPSNGMAKQDPSVTNDPMARMRYGQELASRGEYEAALAEFLWCYDQGMRHDPSFVGVRNSFLIVTMGDLGRLYPPAEDALRERRDAARENVAGREASAFGELSVMELCALNATLGDHEANKKLYEKIKAQRPDARVLKFIENAAAFDLGEKVPPGFFMCPNQPADNFDRTRSKRRRVNVDSWWFPTDMSTGTIYQFRLVLDAENTFGEKSQHVHEEMAFAVEVLEAPDGRPGCSVSMVPPEPTEATQVRLIDLWLQRIAQNSGAGVWANRDGVYVYDVPLFRGPWRKGDRFSVFGVGAWWFPIVGAGHVVGTMHFDVVAASPTRAALNCEFWAGQQACPTLRGSGQFVFQSDSLGITEIRVNWIRTLAREKRDATVIITREDIKVSG